MLLFTPVFVNQIILAPIFLKCLLYFEVPSLRATEENNISSFLAKKWTLMLRSYEGPKPKNQNPCVKPFGQAGMKQISTAAGTNCSLLEKFNSKLLQLTVSIQFSIIKMI